MGASHLRDRHPSKQGILTLLGEGWSLTFGGQSMPLRVSSRAGEMAGCRRDCTAGGETCRPR